MANKAGVTMVAVLGVAVLFLFCSPSRGQETGEALFKAKCAMCHGPDATGKTPMGQKLSVPDLHGADVQKLSDSELKTVVSKGKNKMPPYEGKLSKEQIDKLVAYIRESPKH